MWKLLLLAQAAVSSSDPYEALRARQYEIAVVRFEQALAASPDNSSLRKDLAYTLLKIGETEAARDQFGEVIRRDPRDHRPALEYAYLCHETKQTAEARRVFDRLRKAIDAETRAAAESAFENIDKPLREGIARWLLVTGSTAGNFTAHLELAGLAERRDELALAAEHYRRAWAIQPEKRGLLVDLGRVLRAANRTDEAYAVLVAASRGTETRAAESARELLPVRYPWVNEFRRAIEIDPRNVLLRRDLAFLLLQMERQPEAERELRAILDIAPDDPLTCAQLGLLALARGEKTRAMPLLERVMKGPDEALAAKVRGYLRSPAQPGDAAPPVSGDPKVMAGRSLEAGFLHDALRYLQTAFEADRQDPWIHLKLGWTYNLLRDDRSAIRWFDQARRASDSGIASEAERAYRNLRPSLARVRTTAWVFPFFSSRWRDVFSYAQVKTEFNTGAAIRPYLSARLLGDVRRSTGGAVPINLSENSLIVAAGLASQYWRGLTGWVEAGSGLSYTTGRLKPDYRGGLSYAKGLGPGMGAGAPGRFFETSADGVYISRFQHDLLVYSQNRLGFTPETAGDLRAQVYWSANVTFDAKRLDWANFVETGPGVRLRIPSLSRSLLFSIDLVRGVYTVPQRGVRSPNFFDFRAGFWYAATH